VECLPADQAHYFAIIALVLAKYVQVSLTESRSSAVMPEYFHRASKLPISDLRWSNDWIPAKSARE
jgi:hypothetical protein